MAQTRASIGYDAAFYMGDTSSPIGYTAVLECKNIDPDLFTVPVIDATHLKSPNFTSEKIPGLIMPGTITVSGNFIGDATQLAILTNAQARVTFPFKYDAKVDDSSLTYTLTGRGFVSKYKNGPLQPSGLNEFSLTMEIAGNVDEDVA